MIIYERKENYKGGSCQGGKNIHSGGVRIFGGKYRWIRVGNIIGQLFGYKADFAHPRHGGGICRACGGDEFGKGGRRCLII